jgi:hypothetical protein
MVSTTGSTTGSNTGADRRDANDHAAMPTPAVAW